MQLENSRAESRAAPIKLDDVAQEVQFLPEKTLQDLAKGQLVKLALTCEDRPKVDRVWQSLILTVSTPSLSTLHSAAACNAVSAFLDAAATSKIEETRKLALSPETWLAVFEVFMSRYEDAKPKPLKQLLGSLVTLLGKHIHGADEQLIVKAIVDSIVPSIVLGEPKSRLKASVVCFEMCIRKGSLSSTAFIGLLQEWLDANKERWVYDLGKAKEAVFSVSALDTSTEVSEELAAKVFVLCLLTQTNSRELSGACGNVLGAFLQKMKAESPEKIVSAIWLAPVRYMMLHVADNLEAMSTQILQPVFSADPAGFMAFVNTLPLQSVLKGNMTDAEDNEYLLLFAVLQIGKKTNLVHEDYDGSKQSDIKSDSSPRLVLRSDELGKFLLHREPNIRIAALSLLVTAFSTIKPFTTLAIDSIMRGLPSMHADSDSYSRGEIMSLTRKLIVRVKSGILISVADQGHDSSTLANPNIPAGFVKSDEEVTEFLKRYVDFLMGDLVVTASYPRHISALKGLKLLLESNLDPRTNIPPAKSEVESRWKSHLEVFKPQLLRLLVDLLLDPFEEVRHTALLLLNHFPREILMNGFEAQGISGSSPVMGVAHALSRAELTASNTSRADHADTVARLYHIIFCAALPSHPLLSSEMWWSSKVSVVNHILSKLEERLSSSKGLFSATLREAPLHGYMSGLRYIISMPNFHNLLLDGPTTESWRSIHDRILFICNRVWEEVKPILCIDSPEGHTDDPAEDLAVGPKDILSYSWRALRESSLLLHATLLNTTYGPSGKDGLQLADFENIGRASFIQLAELRHRGAFSTVSQTFATCCERCTRSSDLTIQELPRGWYQDARKTIFESASKLTRRSAGLPALMTGILCSLHRTPFFADAMEDLRQISRLPVKYNKEEQYLELPQVHAMNCLKDIFTNTKLGPFTEPFIMPGLTLSAETLGSPIWALRNSGLMLFRALLTRMCRMVPGAVAGFGGTSGSEPGSKISFPKYAGLFELLAALLASSDGTTAQDGTDIITERIFPALELIGEKVPSVGDDYDMQLRQLVLVHFKSPVWGIREHAARVYASLLTRENIVEDMKDLVNLLDDDASENLLHGTALCVRYCVRRFSASTNAYWNSNLGDLLSAMRLVLCKLFTAARSPAVATCLIQTMNDIIARGIAAQTEDRLVIFILGISEEHDIDGILSHHFDARQPGWNLVSRTRASALLRRALAWFVLLRTLISRSWTEIPAFFTSVSQFDVDVSCWILQQLPEVTAGNDRYTTPLSGLYCAVILGDYSSEAKSLASVNLAIIVEKLLATSERELHALHLPCDQLLSHFRPEVDIQKWNRQSTDSEIRLTGCLLAIRAQRPPENSSLNVLVVLRCWILKLRHALSEETEFTTRHAAAVSVQSFSRFLRDGIHEPRTDEILLEVYLVLYDLLNDDDEELRDIAASTASRIFSGSSISPSAALALGPLNASETLSHFITDHYSDSMYLARRVLEYLTGQEPHISGSDMQHRLTSVSVLMAQYRQESHVLFVEEKQNLFIDEVREVDLWCPVLLQLKRNAYPHTQTRHVATWASEGLEYLIEVIKHDNEMDGLLGWTSKPEAFALIVRVISIASALSSNDFRAPKALDAFPVILQQQLQSLLDVGRNVSLHENLLCRIQGALGKLSAGGQQ
ncbi:hypothetical protein N7539_004632 [Penicillium diatomitis]|uniref:DUF2428 domain-containing protein n=1 Tax=Penicillium diatomitis TaxID=2819901 RepID=A0A9W9XFG6_9EURO|nr:uncharacterized protein N7539_004632 [Penicillium diatomitis]KAJ5489742.1 hypothetical protein N7539_004632 [Penicillium diatomitis]